MLQRKKQLSLNGIIYDFEINISEYPHMSLKTLEEHPVLFVHLLTLSSEEKIDLGYRIMMSCFQSSRRYKDLPNYYFRVMNDMNLLNGLRELLKKNNKSKIGIGKDRVDYLDTIIAAFNEDSKVPEDNEIKEPASKRPAITPAVNVSPTPSFALAGSPNPVKREDLNSQAADTVAELGDSNVGSPFMISVGAHESFDDLSLFNTDQYLSEFSLFRTSGNSAPELDKTDKAFLGIN